MTALPGSFGDRLTIVAVFFDFTYRWMQIGVNVVECASCSLIEPRTKELEKGRMKSSGEETAVFGMDCNCVFIEASQTFVVSV